MQNCVPSAQLEYSLQGCSPAFSSNNGWGNRMEHTGKRLEMLDTEAAKTYVIAGLHKIFCSEEELKRLKTLQLFSWWMRISQFGAAEEAKEKASWA